MRPPWLGTQARWSEKALRARAQVCARRAFDEQRERVVDTHREAAPPHGARIRRSPRNDARDTYPSCVAARRDGARSGANGRADSALGKGRKLPSARTASVRSRSAPYRLNLSGEAVAQFAL